MWDATLLMSHDRATRLKVSYACALSVLWRRWLLRTNTPNVSNANIKNVPGPTGQHQTKTLIRCNRSACCRKARGTLHAATEEWWPQYSTITRARLCLLGWLARLFALNVRRILKTFRAFSLQLNLHWKTNLFLTGNGFKAQFGKVPSV